MIIVVPIVAAAFHLIELHAAGGAEIEINPREITSMRSRDEDSDRDSHFAKGVQCLINLSDGKFVTVVESCADVLQKIKDAEK